MASDARPEISNAHICGTGYDYLSKPGAVASASISENDFRTLRNCGFNLVRIGENYWNIDESQKHIPPGCNVGINVSTDNCILRDRDRCLHFVRKYKDMPHVSMFDFGDEKTLGEQDKIRIPYTEAMNEGMTQLTIFNDPLGPNQEYRLCMLQGWFRPPVWSYDYYPVRRKCRLKIRWAENPSESQTEIIYTGDSPSVGEGMFRWLEMYKGMAARTGRPFWYYAICSLYAKIKCIPKDAGTEETLDDVEIYPVDENLMRFSVFTALAYGAKGLRFWTYSQRKNYAEDANDPKYPDKKVIRFFHNAPINLQNKTTDIYDMVRNVNSEVHALESIFLHSEVSDVWHVWHDTDFRYAHERGTKTLPSSGSGPVSAMSCDGDGVTVTLFTTDGKHYVMFVSHDVNRNQTVRIRWTPGYAPEDVSDLYGVRRRFSTLQSDMEAMDDAPLMQRVDTISLDGCGYCIFSYVPNMAYANPTADKFPICASSPCQEWVRDLTFGMFKNLDECGFNMVDVNLHTWDVRTASELAGENGIMLSVSGFSWRDPGSCLSRIEEFGKLPAVKAWNLYSDLASEPLAGSIGVLAKTYGTVREADPQRLLLWNVIPGTMSNDRLNKLSELQSLLKPGMWCPYTNASCTQTCDVDGNPLPESTPRVISTFYSVLEMFMLVSKATDRPFWHYANCMSYRYAGDTFKIPVSEVIMRHSVFTALAYGAKGIRWWQYAVRQSTAIATYSDAPIGADGSLTPTWHMVKAINTEIAAYGYIFLNARGHEVFHTGAAIPSGTTRLPDGHGPLLDLVSGPAGVTVSFFSSLGKEFMMMVSHDLVNPQEVTVPGDRESIPGRREMSMGRSSDSPHSFRQKRFGTKEHLWCDKWMPSDCPSEDITSPNGLPT